MDSLPNEIVEKILSTPHLTYENILNFGASSKRFYKVIQQSSYIWKRKYQQGFQFFLKYFEDDFTDWYAEIVYIHDLRKRIHELLSTMSPRFYTHNHLSDSAFEEWVVLISESKRAYFYIVDEMLSILHDDSPIMSIKVVPIDTPGNMTLQYYAIKVLRFIRQRYLTLWWQQDFVCLPSSEQLLERGATFIAQWFQPTVRFEWETIAKELSDLSTEVILEVEARYPKHPLLQVSSETLIQWKLYNLDKNQWNIIECQQIMKCLCSVLYEHHQFSGNTFDYYAPGNSYINMALMTKKGLPITLAVIFESVARRVGLKCEPIAFPSHFLLRFTEGNGECVGDSYYIDVFNGGDKIKKGTCPRTSPGFTGDRRFETATAIQAVQHMTNDLELQFSQYRDTTAWSFDYLRSLLELKYVVSPDLKTVSSLCRLYQVNGIDVKHFMDFILSYKSSENSNEAQSLYQMIQSIECDYVHEKASEGLSQNHPEDLKFAVGMVMNHVKYHYTCVIYDWDPICKATNEWQKQMGVHKLRYGCYQPFYNVFVEDGSKRYAAQENLEPAGIIGSLQSNEMVGRYFSHFFLTHYVPNAETERQFPFDTNIRHAFHKQLLSERL